MSDTKTLPEEVIVRAIREVSQDPKLQLANVRLGKKIDSHTTGSAFLSEVVTEVVNRLIEQRLLKVL